MNLIVNPCDFSEHDYQKTINNCNLTQQEYPRDKTLIQLFEAQVARTPNHVAIVYQHQHLTYQALNKASNQVARKIQQHYHRCHLKIEPDTLIALCLDRSPELLIGILAILKTGAAYVPIDPSNPPDRLRFMLEDTHTRLVLTQQTMLNTLLHAISENTALLALDTLDYQFEEDGNLAPNMLSSSLAYVIYTSGTTGLPKGVMITHRNIINYYDNVSRYFDDIENIDFSSSIAFDLSVTTTLIPLLCGKQIIIYPGNLQESEKYIAHLQQANIHFVKSTPSFLAQVFSQPQSTQIKVCFVGGEKLHPAQLHCLLNHCDAVYDEYGPTENTVGTMLIQKTRKLPNDGLIGKPYFNHRVYVLDENQQPVRIGVIGELYVGGAGLARGYLNQPELTQKRFIPNPFASETDKSEDDTHIYQTGDLVRWLPDGNLEYIGRNDFQVKIRGYRIELNEIAHTLSRYSGILQSVVLARENTLIAYYQSDKAVNEEKLIAHLKRWLPEYMLPHHFVAMKAFPLTVNGKVDHEALLQQPISFNHSSYHPPQTTLEKKLCVIWQDILGIKRVGILDDFFRLGGDSIKCMQVIANLLREGIDCRVKDIFTHRSIAQLSFALGKNRTIDAESGILVGDIDLLPVQSWFFEQAFPCINHWNQSFLVRVPKLSIKRLNAILPQLIEHHDALRICFPKKRQQYGVPKCNVTIKQINIGEPVTHTFDIEKGPLWQIDYITGYADDSARLYFAFHHLIIDSVSWRILIDDLKRLYTGKTLGNKGSSYRQWVKLIHHYTQKNPQEYFFWKNQQLENLPAPSLSTTFYEASFTLQANITQHLMGPANKAYHTEINDLLLTALALALSAYFGQASHRITLEGHGREEIEDTLDITRTVGWFTSMYPVLLTVRENIAASIQFIKAYLRTISNKGIGYGAFKYTDATKYALDDLPNITFNYLGQFDTASGYWQVVHETLSENVHPNNKRPHLLDITGCVISGSLHFSLSSYLSQAACTEIAAIFEKQLIAITHHCLDSETQFPANSLQQGFVYHALTEPHSDAYRVQLLLDYHSVLDINVYKSAWHNAIARHPILRTYFNWDKALTQIVSVKGNLNFQLHDLTDTDDKEKVLSDLQIQDRLVPFDLAKPTLMRLHLIKLTQSHFVLLQNAHHSILDGWSTSILLNQVHAFYLALLQGKQPDLSVDNTYLHAQTYIAEHQNKVFDYWNTQLQSVKYANDINALLSNPTNLAAIKTLQKPQQSTIKYVKQQTEFTLNTLVQFAWHKLIQLYTGDNQTMVGTTLSGRSIPVVGIDNSVGLYINTLPLIMSWEDENSVQAQLQACESQLSELNDHSFVELARLQKNGQRLFHSLIIAEYENALDTFDTLKFENFRTIEVLDYPLALIVCENQHTATLTLKYDALYLTSSKAEQLLLQLQCILSQISDKINLPHHAITILTDADYQQIIYDWNDTAVPYAYDKTVHRLFEDQVLKTPDAIALVLHHEQLTYQALNDSANQLAHFIRAQFDITADTLITLCFDHSFEMIISMLAVLKAGAAYVPIDPNYPPARIQTILKDTQSDLILTTQNLIDGLKNCAFKNSHIIAVNEKLYANYKNEKTNNLPDHSQSTDLAYIIYTSGTTGVPKGVMITHQNVSNYLSSITQNKIYQQGTSVDCSSSIAFDATIAVLFAPLVSGRRIILCSRDTKQDTHLYLTHMKKQAVDLIRMTPSYLSALLTTVDHKKLQESLTQVRCLIVGGEKANVTDICTWMKLIPNCAVINHYGPTETTVACALFNISDLKQAEALKKIPLGNPAHNHQFYVLDRFCHPVPVGVVGELYVGGSGVARGYFNQLELTKKQFIENPFIENTRLYKTGDLVRWLPTGNLEFLGRNDFQIKIRGYRVEVSEIEQVLLKNEDISQCAIVFNEKQLVAYYVSRSELSASRLKQYLENHLPNYMIPSAFIPLESIPLTNNGKLNHSALPKPSFMDDTTDHVAPRDELESLLCTLWKEALNAEKIGIDDDFFRMGGHSILAMHLSHQMSQATHLNVTIADIFKYKTIKKLSTLLRTGDAFIDIKPTAKNQSSPLSFAQERLWFIELYEGETDAYHIPLVFELGNANAPVNGHRSGSESWRELEQALQAVVTRHEILRTVFIKDEQGVYQQHVKDEPIIIIHKQINHDTFLSQRHAFLQQPFNLTTEYPIRICLFHLTDVNTHFLMVIFHHVAFDAWSKNIFMKELDYFYRLLANKEAQAVAPAKVEWINAWYIMHCTDPKTPFHTYFAVVNTRASISFVANADQEPLPPLNIQYNDFSLWQRAIIKERIEPLLTYWKTKLNGYDALDFPTDYPRPSIRDFHGDEVHFQLSKSHSLKLKQLAESNGMTLYTVLLTGLCVVLSKHTGQCDFIIGTPTANRPHAQLAGLIGFFVNLLPLRIQLATNNTFLNCLHNIHTTLIEAQCHQELPFATLIERLGITREASRHPLFQILFNLEYTDNNSHPDYYWKPILGDSDYRRSKLDFCVSVQASNEGIAATIHFATALFKRETITQIAIHYERVLTDMIESINQPVQSYSLLNASEYQKIIYDWNATDHSFPCDKTIHQLFEEQVLKTPEKIAVVYDDEQLTYQLLNEKSNQLAQLIRKQYKKNKRHDLVPDTMIAFCLNRSIDMVISLFAILKAGAAYVPIEPHCPADRMRYVLNDTNSALLLTHWDCIALIKDVCPAHTTLLVIDQHDYHNDDKNNLPATARPCDLAYVIYTSGTTGLPKGVMIKHSGVTNIVYHIPKKLFLTENSRVLQFASIAFDAGTLQILNPLTIGATLFIASEKMRNDVQALAHFLKQHKITFAGLPPVLLTHLEPSDYPDLATLVVAGESANAAQMSRWRPGRYLINAYGPTENTIGTSVHPYDLKDTITNIGRPLPNLKVYVLDQYLIPVPIGVKGELYVGGVGVAEGYLNQPELTKKSFIENPFIKNTRLYKTGDCVRWLPNGDLEFLGRNDFQIKIRGYRVELSEIEQVILKHDCIQQCVVVLSERKTLQNDDLHLVAYYVSTSTLDASLLKKHIENQLPSYMVPSIFIPLDHFPLTTNGKLDKKALPKPVWHDDTSHYAAPRNELESLLCTLWQEALDVERIGIEDDFFKLGGHSILAVHLSHRMSLATQCTVAIADIFKYKTIAKLAAALQMVDALIDIAPVAKNTSPLSFAQERLWFIEQYENGTDAYHIPVLFELSSAINIPVLEKAIQSVIKRHEILRTVFVPNEHSVYLQQVKDTQINIIHKEINNETFLSQQKELLQQRFDLSTEYPIRVGVFHLTDKQTQFLMVILHHVAFDAWSKNIFMKELLYFYCLLTKIETYASNCVSLAANSHQDSLPTLEIQYNDFSVWQRNFIKQHSASLIDYWKTKLDGYESLNFPTDYPRPSMMDYRGEVITIELPNHLLEKLQALAHRNHVTLFTLLLTGFSLILAKYTNQTDLLIGTPIVNRQHPQLSNLIGLFVNSLVLRIQLQKAESLENMLKAIQTNLIEAQRYQDLPFEQLVRELNVSRDISRHPLFQMMFTVQHVESNSTSNAPWTPIETHEHAQTAKFDLAISIQIGKKNATVSLQYAKSLFKNETIARFAVHYKHILTAMVEPTDQPIESYAQLDFAEYQKIIHDWNSSAKDFPRNKTIQQLFEEQVEKTPNHIALVFEGQKLTYRQLNEYSNQLAHFIQDKYQHQLNPNTLIGLCVDRSLDLIIGILGILKAGAAYVPIDPDYPTSRIEYIINDTHCELILTHKKMRHLFHACNNKLIFLDENLYQHNSISSLPLINTASDLAYVMYTSGTTGFPKGVMIEHRSVICLLHSQLCDGIDENAKGTLWTNINFDVSVYEIFSMLCRGGELHVIPETIRLDDKQLFHFMLDNQISSVYLPPFFVEKISNYLLECEEPVSLKKVLLGVEPIHVQHLSGFISKNVGIINAYGPTETTVSSTAYPVENVQAIIHNTLPIGRPLYNESVYILDENLSPVPMGVIGELYIGGDGVARGYWGKPDLTRERFIKNPFMRNEADNRLYRTGDLVRWLHDGNIAYVGRSDFQVKIHGLRIELCEIEQVLMRHTEIEHSVVLFKEKILIAYYTGQMIDDVALRLFLSKQLPDSMIPAVFIHILNLPLNPNGKLNRDALPPVDIQINAIKYCAPRNAIDEKICRIWQDIFDNDNIGITDDFFALGGDSITSLQVISKLRYAKINCTIKDIFQCRTIERLVDHIQGQKIAPEIQAEQGILEGIFDLLPIQHWFFEQQFSYPNHWNQAFLVKVPQLSFERLESVLPQLINHHDMLRVRFSKNKNNQWQQYYESVMQNFSLNYLKLKSIDDLLIHLNIWQNSLNLETGPLWQISFIDGYSDGSARLFFTCHHLMIDTVSWRILIHDLKRLYEGEQLNPKTSSYRQWQRTIEEYAATHSNEIDFWQTQVVPLKTVLPHAAHTSDTLIFDETVTLQLLKEINLAYHTKTEELLLSALAYAVCETMGENQCSVTLEGHGRESIDASIDVSETVGWFTCIYPLMLKIKNNISETIQTIKDNYRLIPNKGIGYGALCTPENRLPRIYFNYQGQLNAANDYWSFISENIGTSIHPDNRYDFLILINASVIDGKLHIHFGFQLDAEACQSIVKIFNATLLNIVSHCVHQIHNHQYIYTAGDFRTVKTEADLYHIPIHHDPVAHYLPFEMTSIQKAYALGRLKQFEIGNVANHVYTELCFTQLHVEKLERALNKLILAFAEMRTIFDIDHLTQRYLSFDASLYYKINVTSFDTAYSTEALTHIRNQLTHVVYDVSAYPLFHFSVSHFQDYTVLHVSFDLLLLDAQARMKFFSELTHLYQNENYQLQKRTITFRDYQVYMGLLKSSSWYASDKAYWQEKISHLPLRPKLLLACDPRSIEKPHFKLSKQIIASDVWKKFKENAQRYGVSYSSVLLSLYGFVLSRFSENSDFLITMTLFNRYGIHQDVNNLWGDFTSTNLFGFSRKDGTAIDFFKHTHDKLWDDIAHALYTGLDVQRDLMNLHQLEPTIAVSPIVFTCVVGDTQHRAEKPTHFISTDEQSDKRYWIGQTSQAWIDLQATERDGCFSSGWLYVSQLFSEDFIEALNHSYCMLIHYLAENDWETPLPELKLTDSQMSLINTVNATHQNRHSHTLVRLFEDQAHARPNASAVIDNKGTYDYQMLYKKSQSLSAALHKKGIGNNQLIAVLCEKGFNQVVATLGIMTTGAAYLPLNVEWPLGRIRDILREGYVSHLLVSEMQWDVIKNTVLADEYAIHRIEIESANTLEKLFSVHIDCLDPAYVIYTSGSTGKPKGVCISHAGAVNTLLTVNQRFNINHDDVVLALSELSFDLSVYDLFGVLAVGGTIVFPDQTLAKEPTHWAALIKKHHVTVWDSVPQLMQLLLDNAGNDISSLRVILLSGDWVPLLLVSQLKALPSQPIVMSLGGATEASIWSIWYEVLKTAQLTAIPYGFPMPNQNIYVLNAFGEHCPVGLAGEIHIGGDGLALGYWQDKEKTEQRFINHVKLGRLYKTGDLGKWHAAGYVEFLGRLDNQIKRNGNRVELDEIASKLMQLKGIDYALVRMHQDRLIAYLVSADFKSKHMQGFHSDTFKLAQYGLRDDLENTTTFDNYQFDDAYYRICKSYRQFSEFSLSRYFSCLVPTSFKLSKQSTKNSVVRKQDLAHHLSVLRAKKLKDKVLPKYIYPSAGSSYAVQCIVHIPSKREDLEQGCYYYHPVLHALQRIENHPVIAEFSLELRVCRKAIEPLYGKEWEKFAYLECGHMIYLLMHSLDQKNIGCELRINEMQHENNNLLASLILNTPAIQNPFSHALKSVLLHKQESGIFKNAEQAFHLNDQTLQMQTSEVGHILNSAQALVIFEGENNPKTWIHVGYEAQRCMDYWKTLKIGSCPLGLRLFDNTIYAFALGFMRAEDENTAESHAVGPSLSDAVLRELSQQLPCYMLPHVFMPLESLPLSANGKIDFQALPLPDFVGNNQTYVAPRNEIEKALCTVWEEVLELTQISITDDFFRMGGDSILSIHVTTKLRQLGIQCEVMAIFEYRTIDRLAPHVTITVEDHYEIEHRQIDTSHLGISDELLAELQSRY